MEKGLEILGFSSNEARVYLALLEIGQTTTGPIIKRTGLHRNIVYETLDKLVNKKFVFRVLKRGKLHFQTTDPSRILEGVKEKGEIAKRLIPKLLNLQRRGKQEITIYEGIEGYKAFWLNSLRKLKPNDIDYVAGSIGRKWFDLMGKTADEYLEIRVKKNIKWKMIVFDKDDVELEVLREYPALNEYRLIPRKFEKIGNFNVMGDTIILHSIEEPITIIEIKNKSFAKIFLNLFEIMWKIGKRLK